MSNAAIILLPGGKRGKSLEGADLSKGSFDSLHLRSWVSGRISFNKTPVLKAFKQLENWYGIKINVRKKGLEQRSHHCQRIRGSFPAGYFKSDML